MAGSYTIARLDEIPSPVPPEELAAEQAAFEKLCLLDPAEALRYE